ncbi:hypothetical protein RJ640_000707 [Escallonia rubra]|uniref:CCHC-type domain-containing protein n=1 Tax=Escallonia rubra TaxID=112253 RepID=A0AA88UDI1_9ASTE|nr:hypothetical protein RJ640_000707 [Escallonia rubra]
MKRYICLPTARDIWKALSKAFYDGADELQIFFLNQKAFSAKQNGRSLSIYYGELIEFFSELDHRDKVIMESEKDVASYRKSIQRQRVYIFLAGLDNEFEQVCGEISRKEPVPELEECYSLVRRESVRHAIMNTEPEKIEASAMVSGIKTGLLINNKIESPISKRLLQAKVVSTIRLNLAPKVKYQVLTETSPTPLGQKLEKIYMSKSLSNRLYLKKDLYQLRMDEGSDLGDHISEFNRLVSQLSSIDVKLEEEDHAILLSENKNGHGRGRGRSRSRNSGHGNDRSKSRGKQNKSSIECWYCKEIGHIARKCPKRKDKKNGKKHVNNANVAEEDDKSSDGDLYLVSSVEQQEGNLLSVRDNSFSTEWFLDSACSFHMCPHKEWFDCLTPCNGGTVLMGNDVVCKVMGIGTIKIKMFDGIVRTLGDVRYIPDLKKNLISLGTLDSIDCSISIKGGVMKVSKGAMVIMKGQKTGNLYKLMGKTVIGGASVSTHAGSSNDNSELWHKRLGHLSEGELHDQRSKSADESTDGSTDEQSLEDPEEHPSDS